MGHGQSYHNRWAYSGFPCNLSKSSLRTPSGLPGSELRWHCKCLCYSPTCLLLSARYSWDNCDATMTRTARRSCSYSRDLPCTDLRLNLNMVEDSLRRCRPHHDSPL